MTAYSRPGELTSGSLPTLAANGTRPDRWFGSYADRTHSMRASQICALFCVANRPKVVSLTDRRAVREKRVLASESAVLCPSNASQLAISAYLATCDWHGQITQFRELYRERRHAMVAAPSEHLPTARWTVPDGGFYTSVTLPDSQNAKALLSRAVTARVAYVPSAAFYCQGKATTIRVCLSATPHRSGSGRACAAWRASSRMRAN